MLKYRIQNYLASSLTLRSSALRSIDPALQTLFVDLCEEQVTMHINQDDVKQKKKQRKVETEVSDLKEKLDKTAAGKNLVLSNREIRLLR